MTRDWPTAVELKDLKATDPDRYRRALDSIAERRGVAPEVREQSAPAGKRSGLDALVDHLRKAFNLTEGQTSQLGLIRRGAVYACVTLRADKFASVDDLFGSGHLPDSVCAMALAWISAAPKAVMTGRLSA